MLETKNNQMLSCKSNLQIERHWLVSLDQIIKEVKDIADFIETIPLLLKKDYLNSSPRSLNIKGIESALYNFWNISDLKNNTNSRVYTIDGKKYFIDTTRTPFAFQCINKLNKKFEHVFKGRYTKHLEQLVNNRDAVDTENLFGWKNPFQILLYGNFVEITQEVVDHAKFCLVNDKFKRKYDTLGTIKNKIPCKYCKTPFPPKNSKHEYCTSKCRTYSYRRNKDLLEVQRTKK